MTHSSLTGRVAIVTGGASGIGAACTRRLHALGASVVIADRQSEAAEALAVALGGRAAAVEVDVASEASCLAMVGCCQSDANWSPLGEGVPSRCSL